MSTSVPLQHQQQQQPVVSSTSVTERMDLPVSTDPSSLAKSAVGKGVAHHFSFRSSSSGEDNRNGINNSNVNSSGNIFTFLDPSQLGMGIDNSLSELQSNYQSSLNETSADSSKTTVKSQLRRDSSLIALAMIPSLQSIEPTPVSELQAPATASVDDDKTNFTFIDFPISGEQNPEGDGQPSSRGTS